MKSQDREFYSLLEEGGWIERQVCSIWLDNNKLRKERLVAALDNKKIKFQIFKAGKPLLKKNILSPEEIISSKEFQDRKKELSGLKLPLGDIGNTANMLQSFKPVAGLLTNPRKFIDYLLTPKNVFVDIELMLDARSLLAWLKCHYPLEQAEEDQGRTGTTSDFSLAEILNLITPEMYPDGLKGQGKSAITKSLDTMRNQLPGAFELCCSLVMEAMPCEDREEYLKYTRDDIINAAKKRGIKRPIALQIHKGLPAVMKK
ncbi:MAG: hypothetical protein SD837_15610 [Candidatus Electrothrix scaldis]|nr:MAG: hypothetical protein SD837_15610 [Candidatus Electrothrix sp. GW3-3]